MRYPAAETAEKHANALQSPSQLFRSRGFTGASISEIMKATGLTHGSFYNHFDSKEDLLAEAFAHASKQSMAALANFSSSEEGKQAMLREYLSAEHRDDPENGCIMAALATDFQTQPKTRLVVTRHIRSLIRKVRRAFSLVVEAQKKASHSGFGNHGLRLDSCSGRRRSRAFK